MNNYKKKPFIPAIQKTSTLVLLSLQALLLFIVTMQFKIIEKSQSFDQKVVAAELMMKSMQLLKNYRMESGVFVDIENDPNETGLVGSPFSLITTDEGDLDSKLTTLDPNFSADTSLGPTLNLHIVADMDASDTAKVQFTQSGGSAQTDVDGDPQFTFFSGYLIA